MPCSDSAGVRSPRRVVLFSGHYYQSRRRAGFHFLADAYHRSGWEVTFATVALSWLSVVRRDPRMAYPVRAESGRMRTLAPGLDSFVLFTRLHPANLRSRLLNQVSAPLFRTYGKALAGALEQAVAHADLLVFESTPGLLLVDRCRAINPQARYVYRVSDDLRLLGSHPVVLEAEGRLAPTFDLVSVPSAPMADLFPGLSNVLVQPHGLLKEVFDADSTSPYNPGQVNLVFVGNSWLDHQFLSRASELFPDWQFHLIGPLADLPGRPNIHAYGELPFAATVPYIQHASAGLHTLAFAPGAEAFRDSLKVVQYTYCGLGVVAPEFLRSPRSNVFYYRPADDASISAALSSAVALDRRTVNRSEIRDWLQLAEELAA
jgi:2-beta-glucuronyltransferase